MQFAAGIGIRAGRWGRCFQTVVGLEQRPAAIEWLVRLLMEKKTSVFAADVADPLTAGRRVDR